MFFYYLQHYNVTIGRIDVSQIRFRLFLEKSHFFTENHFLNTEL